jgi:hypothetical protein
MLTFLHINVKNQQIIDNWWQIFADTNINNGNILPINRKGGYLNDSMAEVE